MKIGIIGTGYVGLPTGVGLAELGNEVICIDKDKEKISALKSGKVTIFEDGIAVWGLAFKNGTDDVRESPAMQIVEQLLKNNAKICVYDPKAMANAKKILGDKVEYASSELKALEGADVLAILTEWKEFGEVDLVEVKAKMKNYKIVDLRNMLKNKNPEREGFEYQCIGADC